MEDLAEQWRRQIHSRLLLEGPLLFMDVVQVVKRPAGLTKFTKLLEVVRDDPRFEVTGGGNAMTLSPADPRLVLARPAAAEPATPSLTPCAQHPERDHPPKIDAESRSAWGVPRAEAPAAATAREAAPVRRGVVHVELELPGLDPGSG